MSPGHLTVTTSGSVATIQICNPGKHNAMSLSMWVALCDELRQLESQPSVRVIVLTGEGDRAFVSGADISGFAGDRTAGAAADAYDTAVLAAQRALMHCSKPTLARIQGVCMGGGIGLAMACDLRYASASARFRMPAARLGLGYQLDAMQQIVDTVGPSVAQDLFLTARTLDGSEARRIGLVHDSFDDATFADAVDRQVAALATLAPLTLRAAKAAIRECARPSGAARRAQVEQWVQACFESHDYQEGQRAFRERREPAFTGA
jgi:enoyl-CoA hydratase/carnithine racemase